MGLGHCQLIALGDRDYSDRFRKTFTYRVVDEDQMRTSIPSRKKDSYQCATNHYLYPEEINRKMGKYNLHDGTFQSMYLERKKYLKTIFSLRWVKFNNIFHVSSRILPFQCVCFWRVVMMAMQAEARPYNNLTVCGKRGQKEFENIFRRRSLPPHFWPTPSYPLPRGCSSGGLK